MEIIKAVAKNSGMGVEAIDDIKNVIHDESLRSEVMAQKRAYEDIRERALAELSPTDKEDVDTCLLAKAMLKSSIAVNTLVDKSNKNIAEMLIEGVNMGINELTSQVNKLHDAGEEPPEIATDLLNAYSASLNTLRTFL